MLFCTFLSAMCGLYCTQPVVLSRSPNLNWYWIHLYGYRNRNSSNRTPLMKVFFRLLSSETSNETTIVLSIDSLPRYVQWAGWKAWVSPLGSPPFCSACELPPHRSGSLVLTCTGLSVLPQATLSFPPPSSAPSSSLFPSFGIWPLCLSHVLPLCFLPHSACLPACCLSVHSPMPVSCFPPLPHSCSVVLGLSVLMQNDN